MGRVDERSSVSVSGGSRSGKLPRGDDSVMSGGCLPYFAQQSTLHHQ